MEREVGYPKGPSNNKNYNPRPINSRYHVDSPPNGGNRSGTPTDAGSSARGTPLVRGAHPGRGTPPVRGTPPPRVNAWSRGRPTALAPNKTNQTSPSTPGQGNGTGRGGQPAWAPARGRKLT